MKNELVTLYTELQLIISKLSNPLKTFIAFSIQKINHYDTTLFASLPQLIKAGQVRFQCLQSSLSF